MLAAGPPSHGTWPKHWPPTRRPGTEVHGVAPRSALAKAAQGSAEDVCTQETEPPTDQVRTTSHLRREGWPDLRYQGTWKERRMGCAHAEPQNRRLGREPWHTALCTAAWTQS